MPSLTRTGGAAALPIEGKIAQARVRNLLIRLPEEVLITHVVSPFLTDQDLARFGSTCRSIHTIANNCWGDLLIRDFPALGPRPEEVIYHSRLRNVVVSLPPLTEARLATIQGLYYQQTRLLKAAFTPALYRHYVDRGIFAQPDKPITVNEYTLSSFQGIHGINLDEVGVQSWSRDTNLATIVLGPHLPQGAPDSWRAYEQTSQFIRRLDWEEQNGEKQWREGPPLSLTYREAFTFFIRYLNFRVHRSARLARNAELSLKEKREIRVPHPSSDSAMEIIRVIGNIGHSQKEIAEEAGIPMTRGDQHYISWSDVIFRVLRDRGLIFSVSKDERGHLIQL